MISAPASLLGAAQPRVELRPPGAVESLGAEAVELAAMAGLPLECWQADALNLMLSTRPDGKWSAREYCEIVGRQQGKTVGIGAPRALAGLLLLGERLIMWSAHEYKTAIEAFLAVRQALLTLGEEAGPNLIALDRGAVMVKVNNTNGEEGFALSTGQRMRFIARSKGSGRGFSGDCNLVDEAFAYTRMQQSALAPTMLARPNPQTIYLSSPPLDGRSGEVLFALKRRAEAGDDKLGYRDWGLAEHLDLVARMTAGDRRAFLGDRSNWVAALPALGRGRVNEESIDQLRREMDEFDFAREVLGCWPVQLNADTNWSVIPRATWEARGGAEGRPTGSVAFGVAAAWPDGESASIAVAGRHGGDLLGQVVAAHPGTSWVVDEVVRLRDRHGPVAVVLDKKGPAGHLVAAFEAAGVRLVHPTYDQVAQAAGQFYAAAAGDNPDLRHYGQPELDAAVAAAQKRPLGDAWTWQRQGATDISPLEALTLAVWGLASRNRRSAYEDAELMVV